MAVIIDGGSANTEDKATKVVGATPDNLASLTTTGDLADSGTAAANVPTADEKTWLTAGKAGGALGTAAYAATGDFDAAGAAATVQGNLNTHTGNTSNPHSVTAAQVSALPLSGGTLNGGLTITPTSGTALSINPGNGQIGLTIASTSNFSLISAGVATALQLQSGATQTNSVIRAVWLRGFGGTTTNGYGLGINFALKRQTTADVDAARIVTKWRNAASQYPDLVLYVTDGGGEREALTISADGTQSLISFHGATPQAKSTGWAVTNVTPDKIFDADSTSIDELADVLGTLITYLLARGDLGA